MKPLPMKLPEILLWIGLLAPCAAIAAWRNVCPETEICTLVPSQVNMNPSAAVHPQSIPPTPFANGASVSLGRHWAYDPLRPLSLYNAPATANALLVTKESARIPSWNAAARLSAHFERNNGSVLIVDAEGARVVQGDGTPLATTSFWTSFDDVFLMRVLMPPVRVGNALYAIKSPHKATFKSVDEGLTWTSLAAENVTPHQWLFPNPFGPGLWTLDTWFAPGLQDAGATSAFGTEAYSAYRLFETTDDGASWHQVDNRTSLDNLAVGLEYIAFDPRVAAAGRGTVYGASRKGVLVSQDRGISWSILYPTSTPVNTVAVAYDADTTLLLAATQEGIIASRDAGAHWEPFARGLYNIPQHVYFVNGLLLAGDEAGWFICDDLRCGGNASFAPNREQRGEVNVVEFYHQVLDHYFITSDTAEASGIDAGAAGPGWVRTGYRFTAWTPLGNPIAKDVCRFYGSVSPGPNSHFFSASASECEMLHRLQKATPATERRWNFEAVVFQAEAPQPAGLCRSSTRPVYRAYNDGFARGTDSNHRFVTDRTQIEQLLAQGWKDEGVAFCVQGD
ncbi:MAG: exo-alpha-sialidase [Betaproteobacteria bacterium]|nr:exo-alpha-sialidase [Betaproteobacteria bacterium]